MRSIYPRRPYASAAEVHAGDAVRMCDGASNDAICDREPPGFSDALVTELIIDGATGAVEVEVARCHLALNMDSTLSQRIERHRVDMKLFLRHYQLLTTGSRGERDNRVRALTPYFTVQIPFTEKGATQWHPTDHSGPFSVLQRGAFKSRDEAEQWAREKLGDTVFNVLHIDPMADSEIQREFSAHTGRSVEQARAAERGAA